MLATQNINKLITLSIKDGVLFANYKDGKISLRDAKKIVHERIIFTQNKIYPALITSSGRTEFTKEARNFLSSKDGTKGLSQIALVHGNSLVNLMLINFMLKMHPPLILVKSFENKEKALTWIKTQKTKT